jgi:hypothetical protein
LAEPGDPLRALAVIGTTRDGRFGSHIRSSVLASLRTRRRPGLDVDVLDLRDHPLPLFDGIPPAGLRGSTPPAAPDARPPDWGGVRRGE